MDVLIYTRAEPPCPYCVEAKDLLKSHGIEFKEIDINEEGVREFFSEKGLRTVPQIWIDGKHLGGCQALKGFLNDT